MKRLESVNVVYPHNQKELWDRLADMLCKGYSHPQVAKMLESEFNCYLPKDQFLALKSAMWIQIDLTMGERNEELILSRVTINDEYRRSCEQ